MEGSAWGGIKVKLEVEGELFELELGDDGLIEVENVYQKYYLELKRLRRVRRVSIVLSLR